MNSDDPPTVGWHRPGKSPRGQLVVPNLKLIVDSFIAAQEAVFGDSNDAEHDALVALVNALESFVLVDWGDYSREWLVADFRRWRRMKGDLYEPNYDEIDEYVSQGRPLDSSPFFVRDFLYAWAHKTSQ